MLSITESASKMENIPRMTDEEKRKFVDDFVSGRIYSDRHLPKGEFSREEEVRRLESVFLPLLCGALGKVSESYVNQMGMVWEYLSAAAPWSINGNPVFTSCRVVNVEDVPQLLSAIVLEHDRRQNIVLPEARCEGTGRT
jgi:hypothetical protein